MDRIVEGRVKKYRGQRYANTATGEPSESATCSPDRKWSRAVFRSSKGLSPI